MRQNPQAGAFWNNPDFWRSDADQLWRVYHSRLPGIVGDTWLRALLRDSEFRGDGQRWRALATDFVKTLSVTPYKDSLSLLLLEQHLFHDFSLPDPWIRSWMDSPYKEDTPRERILRILYLEKTQNIPEEYYQEMINPQQPLWHLFLLSRKKISIAPLFGPEGGFFSSKTRFLGGMESEDQFNAVR